MEANKTFPQNYTFLDYVNDCDFIHKFKTDGSFESTLKTKENKICFFGTYERHGDIVSIILNKLNADGKVDKEKFRFHFNMHVNLKDAKTQFSSGLTVDHLIALPWKLDLLNEEVSDTFPSQTTVSIDEKYHSDSGWGEDDNEELKVTFYPDGLLDFKRIEYLYSCWGSDWPANKSNYTYAYLGTYKVVSKDDENNYIVNLYLDSMHKTGTGGTSGSDSNYQNVDEMKSNLNIFVEAKINLIMNNILLKKDNTVTSRASFLFE